MKINQSIRTLRNFFTLFRVIKKMDSRMLLTQKNYAMNPSIPENNLQIAPHDNHPSSRDGRELTST